MFQIRNNFIFGMLFEVFQLLVERHVTLNALSISISSSVGYYVEPTLVETTDPKEKIMQEVRVDGVHDKFCS